MKMMMGSLLAAALMANAVPATAAVAWQVNKDGKLVSATGVVIGKSTYTVTFADGTCASVFGSCSASKFDFKTRDTALAAGNALLSQVLVGSYLTNPGKVFGCNTSTCDSLIPYMVSPDYPDYALALGAANRGSTNRFVSGDYYLGDGDSTVSDPNVNYARFTLQVAVIPEPATWAMMLVGFGMVAGTARYRRRNMKIIYA